MTEDLFHENDIPTVPGLYRMLIKFWVIEHTDWETGAREDDYGIDVLASEKV